MPSSGSGAKVKVIKMHFEIPIEPHTASRPRWTNKGDLTVTHMPKGYREFRNKFNNWLVEGSKKHGSAGSRVIVS